MPETKPVSKLNVLMLFEIIAVIALVYAGKMLGDRYYSPAYLASQYFESLINGHPDKAYEYCVQNDETDFISEDMYCSSVGVGNEKVIGYSIKKKEEDFLTQTYKVTYRFAGDDEKHKMTITMEKNPGKKRFFLFDDWKVSMTDFICKDFEVVVPQNAEVQFDQVALSEKNTKKSFDEDTGCEIYRIDSVFAGEHVIEISRKYYQDVRLNTHIARDGLCYDAGDMYLEKSILDKLAKDAEQKFKYIMQGAANGDYSSVINKCVAKEGREGAINNLQWIMPDKIMKLELTDVSFDAIDGYTREYYEENYGDGANYVAGVVAATRITYYGWEYDTSIDMETVFYYGLDEEGKFEIKQLEFSYY